MTNESHVDLEKDGAFDHARTNSSDSVHSHEHEEHEEHEHESNSPDSPSATNEARKPNDLERTVSSRSSIIPPVKKVPISNRAGLLARLSILYEAQEPKHYPRSVKWIITFIVAFAAAAAPMGSSIILPALNDIQTTYGSSHFITNFSVAFYMLSMSIFPLWWSSISETSGRRAVYIISFALYILWNILAAVSNSIAMFIVMRILSGGSSAAVQAVGAGTISDIWHVKERGRAMGIFYLGPLMGPLLSPVIGGGLTEGLGWRSTQWFQVIYGAVVLLFVLIALPETHKHSAILAEVEQEIEEETKQPFDYSSKLDIQSHAIHNVESLRRGSVLTTAEKAEPHQPPPAPIPDPETIADPTLPSRQPRSKHHPSSHRSPSRASRTSRLSTHTTTTLLTARRLALYSHRILIDPLKIITYLRYPAVALTVYYASIAFGSLYFLNISVQQTFSAPPYNFSAIIVGCLYIFNSVGYFVTSIFGGRWVDNIMHREALRAGRIDARGKPIYDPLDRFRENVIVAALLMPASMLWYGWTANYGVYWLCPMIANFCFGVGSMLLFGAATTMLTEMMPKQASNGVALNNFVRNIFAFVATLAAEPAIDGIGDGWLFTVLGLVSLLSGGVILVMRRYGEGWRERMVRELG